MQFENCFVIFYRKLQCFWFQRFLKQIRTVGTWGRYNEISPRYNYQNRYTCLRTYMIRTTDFYGEGNVLKTCIQERKDTNNQNSCVLISYTYVPTLFENENARDMFFTYVLILIHEDTDMITMRTNTFTCEDMFVTNTRRMA